MNVVRQKRVTKVQSDTEWIWGDHMGDIDVVRQKRVTKVQSDTEWIWGDQMGDIDGETTVRLAL